MGFYNGEDYCRWYVSKAELWVRIAWLICASGPLRIYRVLGSVAFLNSGTTLHPILAKSQCWCVDGESKFVLRIRPNTYYRIELPIKSLNDRQKIEELKTVLANVCQYEATACPFKRGFTVDLPEPPKTPIQKRPWKPKTRSDASTENVFEAPDRLDRLMTDVSAPHKSVIAEADTAITLMTELEDENHETYEGGRSNASSAGSIKIDRDIEATDDTGFAAGYLHQNLYEEPPDFKTPTRPKSLRTGRAITAPPQLTLRTTPPSTNTNNASNTVTVIPLPNLKREPPSLSSSADSFHSFHSPISPLLPSPRFPNESSNPPEPNVVTEILGARSHNPGVSELTGKGKITELWDMTNEPSGDESVYQSLADLPRTPTLMSDCASQEEEHWPEAITPSPPIELRHRKVRSIRQDHSPLPPSSNIYSPYSPRSQMPGHHMTTAILQRTCSLLLGPPIQLVALMLRIAAKIAKGSFRGTSFGFDEGGQKIPCSWDFSDGSDDLDEDWQEDDYGVSLGKVVSSRGKEAKAKEVGGSWEID